MSRGGEVLVEECAKRDLTEVIKDKASIVSAVRQDVVPYFRERGINITVLGLTGEFTYANPKIQEAIDVQLRKMELENQKAAIEASKGGAQMPTVVGGSRTIFQLPMK